MAGLPADLGTFSAVAGIVVTPSDATIFSVAHRALYVGGAGDVTVRMLRNSGVLTDMVLTFSAVPAGTILPIAVDMVKATGTTATFILALR
jgi:hypothetical protein